jgi:two-component system sensor histidine kinase PilS (NtrC family)
MEAPVNDAVPPAPGEGEPRVHAAAALHRKLVWLTFFRVIVVTVLLGGTAFVGWSADPDVARETSPLYALVIATYVASIGLAVALRQRRGLIAVAYAQIAVDVGTAATVVALTARTESVFVFMYSLAIVNGSILLYRRGAVTAAALAVAAHGGVVLALGTRAELPRLGTQALALVAIAVLASYLAELLRRTGERLADSESDLEAIKALHESIVQSVASGLLTLDAARRVTFLNRAGEQMLGLSTRELRGRPAGAWFSAFRTEAARDETELLNARGERMRIGYSSFPLLGRGKVIGTAVIFQDLTRMRAMEEAVARTERLADLGRVAAGLAHEIRNPLASMSGSIELLRGHPALGGEDRRLMDIVLREAERLEHLVREFLAFARPAPPRPVRVDLAAIVGEALDVFVHDPVALRTSFERALAAAAAHGDPDQLRQVIWNLLANASQACAGRGGTIRVATGSDGEGAWLRVEDDGAGIDPGDLDRIFVPFFTTKEQGTGLGLSAVERIVTAHGGRIDVASRPGEGTRFTVRLPAAQPAAARATAR